MGWFALLEVGYVGVSVFPFEVDVTRERRKLFRFVRLLRKGLDDGIIRPPTVFI